jgi:hypothetical protein
MSITRANRKNGFKRDSEIRQVVTKIIVFDKESRGMDGADDEA